jgi:hypothetical protein
MGFSVLPFKTGPRADLDQTKRNNVRIYNIVACTTKSEFFCNLFIHVLTIWIRDWFRSCVRDFYASVQPSVAVVVERTTKSSSIFNNRMSDVLHLTKSSFEELSKVQIKGRHQSSGSTQINDEAITCGRSLAWK